MTVQTKGKVEKPFQFVEGNLLNARKFQDLDDLRAMARWWMENRSDPHLHETTGRVVLELFMEQELSALNPLPLHPYDCSQVALRVCRIDGFIEFETNIYSVPYECVGDILTFKASEHEIFIYSQELDLVAHHERLPMGVAGKVENPLHRTHPKVRYGFEPVKEAFLALGDAAEAFATGLKEKHPRNCGFHARFILQLKGTYCSDDIGRALAHAIRYQAFDGKAVERILEIEVNALIERRIERRIKESRLPERKLLADFDFAFQKGLDKAQIMELATLSFVERKQGLIMAGSSGTGNYAKYSVM